MVFAICLVALSAAKGSPAVPLQYRIYFNGGKCGTEDFTRSDTGEILSTCHLTIAGTQIDETLTAQFNGQKLVSSDEHSDGPTGKSRLTYQDGKLTKTVGANSRTLSYTPKHAFYGASLIVPLWQSAAGEALRLLAHSEASEAPVDTYLVDIAQELPVVFRRLPSRKANVHGVDEVAQAVQINLASVQGELDVDSKGRVVIFDVPGQKLRFVLDGWEGLFVDPLSKYPELSQPTFETVTESKVSTKMRDGVELVSTVVKPTAPGKYPAILSRTPYARSSLIDGQFYASRGYVYVGQDVRGRGDSQGIWDPFVNEGPDGYDTIQWMASQPWSDGKVGMIGGSYGGYVQWAAAVLRPPALKCIVPQVSPPDAMHNMPYDFGVPFLYGDLWWAKIVAGPQLDFSSLNSPLPNVEQLSLLPLETLDVQVLGIKIPFYRKWLTRTTEGDWKGFDFYEHLNNAHVPALQISGWFDGDGIGTKLIWSAERKLGRKDQWLIEGPWTHAFNTSSSIGKVNFGPSAIIDLDSLYLRWFDTWLKQKSVHLDSVPKAQIFVTGLNRWRKMSDWPSSSEKTEKMWLTSSAGGVPHALVPEIPPVGSESYTYDPSKDLETSSLTKEDKESDFTGEFNLASKKTGGFFVYKSTPFKHATDIAGPAELDLYFKTNTVNTDFFVDVVDVDPSGHAYLIGEPGKIRGSYLHGVDRIIPLVPGKAYEAKILPWDFAHEFKKGHRLGVVLSSTFFPLYARNLGTIDPISTATRMVVQRNTILFGKNHPSCFTYHILQP